MKYKDVIIVDENNNPMIWDEESHQLVYCTDDTWRNEPVPVETYTVKKAARLISKTIANRLKWNMSPGKYKTMPFSYPMRKSIYTHKYNILYEQDENKGVSKNKFTAKKLFRAYYWHNDYCG